MPFSIAGKRTRMILITFNIIIDTYNICRYLNVINYILYDTQVTALCFY